MKYIDSMSTFTTKAIYLMSRLVDHFRETKKDLYMVFIDLKIAYHKVLTKILYRFLEVREVHVAYMRLI